MFRDRLALYEQLEQSRGSKLLTYVTGDRSGMEAKISAEVFDYIVGHLDSIGDVPKISLYLYTRGGDVLASWGVANLIRQFCKELEVIIPAKAHSGGTLICLGANAIVMTKQATLSPIDPSVHTPLNPQIPGAPPNSKAPVSVESLHGFLEFARSALGESADLKDVFLALASSIHPLVLGQAFRTRTQIKMLGRKLLSQHMNDEQKQEKILNFLCSESGSHDYTVNRSEARKDLELNVEKPDDPLYGLIKATYDDIAAELALARPYDPRIEIGADTTKTYSFRRALIESRTGGCHYFVSEGSLQRRTTTPANMPGIIQEVIEDDRTYEGWRHDNA